MKFKEALLEKTENKSEQVFKKLKVGMKVKNTRNGEIVTILNLKSSVVKAGQRAVFGGKYQKLTQDIDIYSVKIQYDDGEIQTEDPEFLEIIK